MTQFWNQLEGVCMAGRYVLQQCLTSTPEDAWFLTRLEDGRAAAVRVMPDNGPLAAAQLALWQDALALEHPCLVEMLDAARTDASGTPLIYAVCEFPDDFLGGVLQERALTTVEAQEVLRSSLDALAFVHSKGLVHGAVDPLHIMAFGDRIKLPSDTLLLPANNVIAKAEPGPYDSPELALGMVSPAADMWALGMTLYETLTQQRPDPSRKPDLRQLAEPFATIIRNCLNPEPQRRWSVKDIESFLNPVEQRRAPEPAVPHSLASVEPAKPFSLVWGVLIVIVAAMALAYAVFHDGGKGKSAPPASAAPRDAAVHADDTDSLPDQSKPDPLGKLNKTSKSPVPAKATMAAEPITPPAAPGAVAKDTPATPVDADPAPSTSAIDSAPAHVWRVIAYTYNTRTAAERKLTAIKENHPELQAELYSTHSDRGPYLISIGGPTSHADADARLASTRHKGLPRDTFVRNFPN